MEIHVRESGGIFLLDVHGRLTIGEPAEPLHSAGYRAPFTNAFDEWLCLIEKKGAVE